MTFAELMQHDRFVVDGVDEFWVKVGKRGLRYSSSGAFLGAYCLVARTPVKRLFTYERYYDGL